MQSHWLLIHRSGHASALEETPGALLWKTCLRQIALLPEGEEFPSLQDSDQVLEGEEAYRFLLEIICGLRSPMLGETEVMGQFKEFCASVDWDNQPQVRFFRDVALQLLSDAKKVRTKYLKDLGSQSYGSLARRWLSPNEKLHILGGGRLVQDVLPWLAKINDRICIYVRDPEKLLSAAWFKPYAAKVEVRDHRVFSPDEGGLLICAPLTSKNIESWLKGASISRILDLRGESEQDPIKGHAKVQSLQQAFKKIEANKDRVLERGEKALGEIAALSRALSQTQKVRPFGWDDLCA
jgi:glutamyl-tRNA reductase